MCVLIAICHWSPHCTDMYCIKLTPIMYMLTSMEAGNVTTAVQLMTILHLIPTRGTARHVNMICVRCVPDTVMSVSLKTT